MATRLEAATGQGKREYRALDVRKITPAIGAEVYGVDLTQPLSDQVFAELQEALLENLVIVFRDQAINEVQQIQFARRFGKLYLHPQPKVRLEGFPEIIVIHVDEKSTHIPGENWHSDASYEPAPPWGTMLHLIEAPSVGGDTLFANMYRAYETLSDGMKRFLAGLTAIHDRDFFDGKTAAAYGGGASTNRRAEQPVIRPHPVTGRPVIFVNPQYTTRIVQLKPAESDAVLRFLFEHCQSPEFQVRVRWRPHSIAFWDNRCTWHKAIFDYFPQRRHGLRCVIGDVGGSSE